MNFLKIASPLTMFLLSMTRTTISVVVTDPATDRHDEPFWQHVLREFIFKTISQPLPDDTLYTKIRDAPFYGGPLPKVMDNDEGALLSRGSVFRVADEQWILCQDDCEDCESCAKQNIPMVRWALRKVRRSPSEGPPKWDLQLTVLPQLNKILRTSSQLVDNRPYAKRQSAALPGEIPSATGDEVRQGSHEQNPDWINSKYGGRSYIPYFREQEREQEHWRRIRSKNIPGPKERQTSTGTLGQSIPPAFHYSPEERPRMNSLTDKFRNNENSRLIVGIDQRGEKHLVHVVPIRPAPEYEARYNYPFGYRGPYRPIYTPRRITRTIHPGWNEAAYDKLVERILESLDTHRNIIEAFMFSERLVPEISKELYHPPYPIYPGAIKEDERLHARDGEVSYTDMASRQGHRYRSEYQVDEQDQHYKRYADTTEEVNRPKGVYPDQSSGIEPYGIFRQDEPHDERSMPREDTERRRRNSRAKPTYSSPVLGYQGISGNRTHLDNTDWALDLRRKAASSMANHDPNGPRFPINHTSTSVS